MLPSNTEEDWQESDDESVSTMAGAKNDCRSRRERASTLTTRAFSRRSLLRIGGMMGMVSAASIPSVANSSSNESDTSFDIVGATVADIHAAITIGRATAHSITKQYLARINAYDGELNAIINVNPDVLERAEELDAQFDEHGISGPLHGIPVILKDNYDTGDMPTTAGSVALQGSIPPDDAFLVKQLRNAGGIILAKANLQEFAYGRETISSLGGQTHNPYALDRVPGGSSGGPAAATAADLGTISMGTDTCASIREPAAYNNLVGLRPTIGLLSRDGIIPMSSTQDTGGPITRTVSDTAVALDALVGYDPQDPVTARSVREIPEEGYTSFLNIEGLADARIGVLREYFGCDEVNKVVEKSIKDMEENGAEIVDPIKIPQFEEILTGSSVIRLEFNREINEYFDSLGEDAPVDSLNELIESGDYTPRIEGGLLAAQEVDVKDLPENLEYKDRLLRRGEIQQATLAAMAENDLDAILHPTSDHLPTIIGEQPEQQRGTVRNCTLSAVSGFPAISLPAGFSSENDLPVGVELLGRAFSEPRLIEIAYSYEQATQHRRSPEKFGSR